MFTGIIEATAFVACAVPKGEGKRVTIATPRGWKLAKGGSVAVDGICSTVVAASRGEFEIDYMPTTLKKTTARGFRKGTVVNLERPLKYGARVHGHFVLGHVDGRGTIKKIHDSRFMIQVPRSLMRYVAERGSITVNGIALTVAALTGTLATVALIPYTLSHTNLGRLKRGDRVNLEVDLLARYGHAKKTLRKTG